MTEAEQIAVAKAFGVPKRLWDSIRPGATYGAAATLYENAVREGVYGWLKALSERQMNMTKEHAIAARLRVQANANLAAAYGVDYRPTLLQGPSKITIGNDGRGSVVSTWALTHDRRRTHRGA